MMQEHALILQFFKTSRKLW